jgi:hypothetical protein
MVSGIGMTASFHLDHSMPGTRSGHPEGWLKAHEEICSSDLEKKMGRGGKWRPFVRLPGYTRIKRGLSACCEVADVRS